MNAPLQTWIHWAPRAFAIGFALSLSLFALEVVNEHRGVLDTAIALLIHLTPVWLVLAALAVAWRFESAGGLLFFGLAAWYAFRFSHHHLRWFLVIGGPAIVIGTLFLLSARFSPRVASPMR